MVMKVFFGVFIMFSLVLLSGCTTEPLVLEGKPLQVKEYTPANSGKNYIVCEDCVSYTKINFQPSAMTTPRSQSKTTKTIKRPVKNPVEKKSDQKQNQAISSCDHSILLGNRPEKTKQKTTQTIPQFDQRVDTLLKEDVKDSHPLNRSAYFSLQTQTHEGVKQ